MKIEDDRGHPWRVEPGDPASKMVNLLRRLNYSHIVLTIPLLCGIMRDPLGRAQEDPPSDPASSPEAYVRAVVLSDCIAAIRKAGLFGTE